MKKISILLMLLFPAFLFSGCGKKPNENNTLPYKAQRTGEITNRKIEENNKPPTETLLAEYTTEINPKPANRINNIKVSCSELDGTIVKNGEEFSFCNTVGQATSEKGYKEADVIINKRIVQALGGRNVPS